MRLQLQHRYCSTACILTGSTDRLQKRAPQGPGCSVFLDHPIDRLDDPISGLDQAIHFLKEAAIGFLKRSDQLGECF